MKKKKRLDIYKTQFDIDLVVANKYVTLEELKEKYKWVDNTELDDRILKGCGCTGACIDKETEAFVILVKYNRTLKRKDIDKFLDVIDTAVHEGMHALLNIYNECSINIHYDNQEPVCYDAGKIVTNILKTLLDR